MSRSLPFEIVAFLMGACVGSMPGLLGKAVVCDNFELCIPMNSMHTMLKKVSSVCICNYLYQRKRHFDEPLKFERKTSVLG